MFRVVVEEKKQRTLDKVMNAKQKVRAEITDLSNKLKEAKETINKFATELRSLEEGSTTNSLP